MILTNNEIFMMTEGLTQFFDLFKDCLPAKLGFRILKNSKELEKIYLSIIGTRDSLLAANAEENDGVNVKIAEDKIEYVNKQLKELGEIENEVNINPIKLNEIEDLMIPIDILNQIFKIIEE